MKFFCELYNSSYNNVKGYSSVMRYFNELILKGRVKRVSLLLTISIDSDHFFFFFFMHTDVVANLVLKRVEDIVRIFTQYAICNMYILHLKYFYLVKL
jgi:SRSO17 transposase